VNGVSVGKKNITADGKWQDIALNPIKQSSWVALRIYQSSHTTCFCYGWETIRLKKIAEWCRVSGPCWKVSKPIFIEGRQPQAAYDKAAGIYDDIIRQAEGL
jgi:hypothetical protein